MLVAALERRVQNLVLFALTTVILLVTPWMNLDPINLPKYFVLVVIGFALLGNLAPNLSIVLGTKSKLIAISVLGFLVSLLAVYLWHLGNPNQLHGTYGRNNGLLSYATLAIFLLAVALVRNPRFLANILYVLILTGSINAVYGFFQWLGRDPVDWTNPYNPIVGTLGNPNFISAHLGITALVSLSLILGKLSAKVRFVLIINICLSIFVIYKSDSSQGLLVFLIGSGLLFYLRFLRPNRLFGSGYLLGYVAAIFLGIFGIFNKGPFATYLYQGHLQNRGDYWRAGWRMTIENPWFGVGLDSYGDWYRFYRDNVAVLRNGPDVISNSAHNVFLDISSSGGFLLLLPYCIILGLIARSGFRIVKKAETFDAIGFGLIVAWLAYLAQSTVSINHLGLAISGWVLGGAIIGYDEVREKANSAKSSLKVGNLSRQVPASIVVTGTLGLISGILISIWPVVQDVAFRSALVSGDPAKIIAEAERFPGNSYYYNYAGEVLLNNKLEEQALDLAREAIKLNTRDFRGWRLLFLNPKSDETERQRSQSEMKKIDPLNLNIDKSSP